VAGVPFLNLPLWMLRCCLQEKMMIGKDGDDNERGREVGTKEKKVRKGHPWRGAGMRCGARRCVCII